MFKCLIGNSTYTEIKCGSVHRAIIIMTVLHSRCFGIGINDNNALMTALCLPSVLAVPLHDHSDEN